MNQLKTAVLLVALTVLWFGDRIALKAAQARSVYTDKILSGLFSTHPPIEERIRRLEAIASVIPRVS